MGARLVRRWLRCGPLVLIVVLAVCEIQTVAEAAQTPAERTTDQLLYKVPMPPDGRPVSHPPSDLLRHPASSIGCTPLVDKARFISVNGTLQTVTTFLRSHHPRGWIVQGFGGSADGKTGKASSDVTYAPLAKATALQPELVVTYAGDGMGKVGIRVDAEVVPPDARCVYH
jgi:hypothetical protein